MIAEGAGNEQQQAVVFPRMARWLPDDETAQLCFESAREIERIEALMASQE